MSHPGAEAKDRRALARLDEAVRSVLSRIDELEERAGAAERRVRELDELLESFRAGDEDPAELAERADRLELENRALRRRLGEGRTVVERIRARIRFLEEQR